MMPLQIKLIATAVMFAALAGAGWYVHHAIYQSGWDARDVIAKRDTQIANDKAAAELASANDKIHVLNLSMSRNLDSINTSHYEAQKNADDKIASLSADLRSARLRLSVSIAAGSCTPAGPDQNSAAGAGDRGEARAELMPEVAADLLAIAANGDSAVRRANACVDAYNAVRDQVNAQ